ncbi:MAG: hypothetical protein QME94_15375, partial [Anaerolineae bacterium]|nr:hypothetical protein [Anaerolineae bacterium]
MAALNGATADVEGLAGWAMAPGAAMRAGEEGATVDWHRAFVESADFNSWQVEDLPAYAVVERARALGHGIRRQVLDLPAYAVAEGAGALDRVGGRLIPRRADGFVLRNDLVHCSLAHRYRDHAVWVTALSSLAGPWGPLLTEPSSYG